MIGTHNKFIAALLQTVTVLVGKWSPPSLCIFLNEEGIFKVFSMVQFWLAISHTFCTAENTCELFHTVFTATQNVQCQNMSSSRGVNAQTWWYQLSQVSHWIHSTVSAFLLGLLFCSSHRVP